MGIKDTIKKVVKKKMTPGEMKAFQQKAFDKGKGFKNPLTK